MKPARLSFAFLLGLVPAVVASCADSSEPPRGPTVRATSLLQPLDGACQPDPLLLALIDHPQYRCPCTDPATCVAHTLDACTSTDTWTRLECAPELGFRCDGRVRFPSNLICPAGFKAGGTGQCLSDPPVACVDDTGCSAHGHCDVEGTDTCATTPRCPAGFVPDGEGRCIGMLPLRCSDDTQCPDGTGCNVAAGGICEVGTCSPNAPCETSAGHGTCDCRGRCSVGRARLGASPLRAVAFIQDEALTFEQVAAGPEVDPTGQARRVRVSLNNPGNFANQELLVTASRGYQVACPSAEEDRVLPQAAEFHQTCTMGFEQYGSRNLAFWVLPYGLDTKAVVTSGTITIVHGGAAPYSIGSVRASVNLLPGPAAAAPSGWYAGRVRLEATSSFTPDTVSSSDYDAVPLRTSALRLELPLTAFLDASPDGASAVTVTLVDPTRTISPSGVLRLAYPLASSGGPILQPAGDGGAAAACWIGADDGAQTFDRARVAIRALSGEEHPVAAGLDRRVFMLWNDESGTLVGLFGLRTENAASGAPAATVPTTASVWTFSLTPYTSAASPPSAEEAAAPITEDQIPWLVRAAETLRPRRLSAEEWEEVGRASIADCLHASNGVPGTSSVLRQRCEDTLGSEYHVDCSDADKALFQALGGPDDARFGSDRLALCLKEKLSSHFNCGTDLSSRIVVTDTELLRNDLNSCPANDAPCTTALSAWLLDESISRDAQTERGPAADRYAQAATCAVRLSTYEPDRWFEPGDPTTDTASNALNHPYTILSPDSTTPLSGDLFGAAGNARTVPAGDPTWYTDDVWFAPGYKQGDPAPSPYTLAPTSIPFETWDAQDDGALLLNRQQMALACLSDLTREVPTSPLPTSLPSPPPPPPDPEGSAPVPTVPATWPLLRPRLLELFEDSGCIDMAQYLAEVRWLAVAADLEIAWLRNPVPPLTTGHVGSQLLQQRLKGWLSIHAFLARHAAESDQLTRLLDLEGGGDDGTEVSVDDVLDVMQQGWSLLLYSAFRDPLANMPGEWIASPDYRPRDAGIDLNNFAPHHEQGLGLPVVMVETMLAHLRLLERRLETATPGLYAECSTSDATTVRDQVFGAHGEAMRMLVTMDGLAVAMHDKAAASLAAGGTVAWEDRWTTARQELEGTTRRIGLMTNQVLACTNPLGISESDLPLYFVEPQTTNQRFFASSDYLLSTWARPAVASAAAGLDAMRASMLAKQESEIRETTLENDRDRTIEQLKTTYGQHLRSACGLEADAEQVFDEFAANEHDLSTCYRNYGPNPARCEDRLVRLFALTNFAELLECPPSGAAEGAKRASIASGRLCLLMRAAGRAEALPAKSDGFMNPFDTNDDDVWGGAAGIRDSVRALSPDDQFASQDALPSEGGLWPAMEGMEFQDCGRTLVLWPGSESPVVLDAGEIKKWLDAVNNIVGDENELRSVAVQLPESYGPQGKDANGDGAQSSDDKPPKQEYIPESLEFQYGKWCGAYFRDWPLPAKYLVDGVIDPDDIASALFDSVEVAECLRGELADYDLRIIGARQAVRTAVVQMRTVSNQYDTMIEGCNERQGALGRMKEVEIQRQKARDSFSLISTIAGIAGDVLSAYLSGGATVVTTIADAAGAVKETIREHRSVTPDLLETASNAGVSAVIGLGLDTLRGDAEDSYELARLQLQTDLDRIECSVAAHVHIQTLVVHVEAVKSALIAATTALVEKQSALAELRALITEGGARIHRELTRQGEFPDVRHHYWLDEKTEIFKRDFVWAKRLTYLAMRAAEFELQQSFDLRKMILEAELPYQLENAIREIEREQASRGINGKRPEAKTLNLSLRDDLLRLGTTTVPGASVRSAPASFVEMLTSPDHAVFDSGGVYLGQGIPFHLAPVGALHHRCAERVWSVNAAVHGDMLGLSDPQLPVFLLKRNTFGSQWCDGRGPDGQQFQTGAIRPSINLFKDGSGTGQAGETEAYAWGYVDAWINVSRKDFFSEHYTEGGSDELAGRGLYGDYMLLVPWYGFIDQAPNATSPEHYEEFLSRVEDIFLKFDYISVDNGGSFGDPPPGYGDAGTFPQTGVENFVATPGANRIKLTWKAPWFPGLDEVVIWRSTEGYLDVLPSGPTGDTVDVLHCRAADRCRANSLLETNRDAGVKYYYSAFAIDEYGDSEVAHAAAEAQSAAVPTDFVGAGSYGFVGFRWSQPTFEGFDRVEIVRNAGWEPRFLGDGEMLPAETFVLDDAGGARVADRTGGVDKAYFYRLFVVDDVGVETGGPGIQAQAYSVPPVTLAAATTSARRAHLTWSGLTSHFDQVVIQRTTGTTPPPADAGTGTRVFDEPASPGVADEDNLEYANTVYSYVIFACRYGSCTAPLAMDTTKFVEFKDGFEDGLGNWSQQAGDNFDWMRSAGETVTLNTGPHGGYAPSAQPGVDFDPDQYYLYTNSAAAGPYKLAGLDGPVVNLVAASGASISFAYHMYGQTMGCLHVGGRIDANPSPSTIVSWICGTRGDAWVYGTFDLSPWIFLEHNVGFRFQGYTYGTTSDIAIDEVAIRAWGY